MWLEMHKPLWCDELYGQKIAIEGSSWGKVLTGRVLDETYNFPPLFYTFQKVVTLVFNFHLPDYGKNFLFVYPKGQIILRLFPDALMTTAIVLLVRYFWATGGIAVGLMALLSALSSGMVWWYWVEARGYPLWFLLSLLQAILLIQALSDPNNSGKSTRGLIVCHWLLIFTATLWYIQVLVAQLILFVSGRRRFKDHLWGGCLPLCFGLAFFSRGSQSTFYLSMNPVDMIKLNLSFEQVMLLFFYLTAFLCRAVWIGKDNLHLRKMWKGFLHLPNLFLALGFSITILTYVYCRWPSGQERIAIYPRHFLFLSALGVVLVPAMFSDLWSQSRKPFWRGIFLVVFVVLLFSQFLEGFSNAWFQGFYF